MIERVVLFAAVLAALALILVMVSMPPADVDVERGDYWGARVLPPGPAWAGIPAIPVEDHGTLTGIPSHLDWLRYGDWHQPMAADPDYEGNNTFHYWINPEKLRNLQRMGSSPWWVPLLGQPVRAADFPEDWSGAPALWRSEGAEGAEIQTVIVIRTDDHPWPSGFGEEFAPDGFVAFSGVDMRNGCGLDYAINRNPRAYQDGEPLLFDPCHDSRYDPRDVRRYSVEELNKD